MNNVTKYMHFKVRWQQNFEKVWQERHEQTLEDEPEPEAVAQPKPKPKPKPRAAADIAMSTALGQATKTVTAAKSVIASAASVETLIADAKKDDDWIWAKSEKVHGVLKRLITTLNEE
eukprot:5550231-Pyramimonas_sp.AAC.1